MKTAILLLCILAVGLTQAFTLDKPIIKLQPTLQETKSKDGAIGRSWIDCSKYYLYIIIMHYFYVIIAKPGGPGKILNLTITPDPPERGEPIAFYFVFSDSKNSSITIIIIIKQHNNYNTFYFLCLISR